jgi:hypothetical protein
MLRFKKLAHSTKRDPARQAIEGDAVLRLGGRRLVPRMDLRRSIRLHRAVHDVVSLVAAVLLRAAAVLAYAVRVRDARGDGQAVDDTVQMVNGMTAGTDPGHKVLLFGFLGEVENRLGANTAMRLGVSLVGSQDGNFNGEPAIGRDGDRVVRVLDVLAGRRLSNLLVRHVRVAVFLCFDLMDESVGVRSLEWPKGYAETF